MRRLRHPQLTLRARLTLVYGGLFLAAGVLLLGVTYALVSQGMPGGSTFTVTQPEDGGGRSAAGPPEDIPPPDDSGARLTQVADQTWQDALDALLTRGGIALAVVGAAATGFGWLIAGRMLQPLHRVTETARRIARAPAADRGLHERIGLDGPYDEVKELADTFDLMLERLDGAFDGQRRFIANASHELRTPLALNRALLEVAVHRGPASAEVRHLGETLLEINARHERLIDGLLLLARSERELTDRGYVDLADIVEHVCTQVEPGTVEVRTEPQPAPTTGNAVLLERLVQNLVDNGIRHNLPEAGWVQVATGADPDGSAVLRVSNTGPTVPRYEIPKLFEPFRRLATDRLATVPGAGLGLSIVQAVARAHDGEVRVDPRDGGGLVVTVSLPGGSGPAAP